MIQAFVSALIFLLTQSHANQSDFASLPDDRLIALRQKAFERVEIISEYNSAQNGLPAETNPQLLTQSFHHFIAAGQEWSKVTQLARKNTGACIRYFKNTDQLLDAIENDYLAYRKLPPHSKSALTLQAKSEGLSVALLSEMELMKDSFEGSGNSCSSSGGEDWKLASGNLENALLSLSQQTWGKPGINDAFPVSSRLLVILNQETEYEKKWHTAKLAADAALVAAIILLLNQALDRFKNVFKPITLKGFTLLAFGAYGAYTAFNYAKKRFRTEPYIADSWNAAQYSSEELLNFDTSDTEASYKLALAIETSVLQSNKYFIGEVTPQINLAKERFGSLEAAQALAREKLKEINSVINERHLDVTIEEKK